MRSLFSSISAATIAVAMGVGGLLLIAPAQPASAAGATSDLSVTYFRDQQPNGQYDEGEDLNPGLLYAQDAAGNWYGTGAGDDGTFNFADLPAGEYQVYFQLANPRSTAFNVDGNERMEVVEVPRVTDATWINSRTGERSTFSTVAGERSVTTVTVSSGSDMLQVGVSMISSTAVVFTPGSEEPTYEAASIAFIDGADEIASYESASNGDYLAVTAPGGATQYNFLEAAMGVVVTPVDGYVVESVTATNSGGEALTVTNAGTGVYTIARSDLTSSFDRATFTVTLAEAPTPTPTETATPTETPTETATPTATADPTDPADPTTPTTPGQGTGGNGTGDDDGLASTDGGNGLLIAAVAAAALTLGGAALLLRRRTA
ncbi:hypothetical protein GCM10011490_02290 [Pseudoclavibacter endophyticus]|uniref:Gram-positive cocci surface proteins LPxTG domain-containing protein n=1 Tax=Pseudoclavibacter endophyticus TaxID=1778590 RepID=A0A6H9WRH6_9MICO|nr:hypothetical protein [Pseudoclavibacter endophyticus]KAB1650231.1 hypothetical protein F8O04_08565 [Pseudoclavibacter endophyticus]GGA55990.1 hypothetical protein GCM10011490_02290 [Pseudoclavibacter endophyticus]